MRDELGLDYTLGQVESLALSEADRVGGITAKVCAKYGRGRSADAIIEKARSGMESGGWFTGRVSCGNGLSGFLIPKAKAVGFPVGDELHVRLVPEFMRHLYPTAAYSSPGPFEKRQRGIFWVNDLSLAKSSAAEKLSEVQQHFGISLTAAHEAYPGHHLQFVTANGHARKWRPLLRMRCFMKVGRCGASR